MFNCINKDQKRRNRFKKFEIKILQNKTIFQDHLLLKNFIKLLSASNYTKQKLSILLNKKNSKLCVEQENLSRSMSGLSSAFNVLQKDKINQLYFFWIQKSLQSSIRKTDQRSCSQTRIKNRCIESGRARSVLRFCRFSRIVLRDKASKGLIPGVSKASW